MAYCFKGDLKTHPRAFGDLEFPSGVSRLGRDRSSAIAAVGPAKRESIATKDSTFNLDDDG